MVGLKEENKYCGVEQKSARWAHNPEVVVEHFPPPLQRKEV